MVKPAFVSEFSKGFLNGKELLNIYYFALFHHNSIAPSCLSAF
jgi:hypothetical protein